MHYDRVTAPDHGQEEISEHGIPRTLGGWPLRALMAIALRTLPEVSLLLWPAILLANGLAVTVCVRRGVVLPLLATLTLTMVTAALWLHRMPRDIPSLHTLIGVVMSLLLVWRHAANIGRLVKGTESRLGRGP